MSTLFLVLGVALLAAAAFLPIRGGFSGGWKVGTGVLALLGLLCLFAGVSVVQVPRTRSGTCGASTADAPFRPAG